MSIIFVFKSVTYAQKAEKYLASNGIVGNAFKAPMSISNGSCSHGVKVVGRNTEKAKQLIMQSGLPYIDIFVLNQNGKYERMTR